MFNICLCIKFSLNEFLLSYIYALIQILSLGFKIFQSPQNWMIVLKDTCTPMFGGWYLPTIIVLGLSLIIFYCLIQDFLKQSNFLFAGTDGQYVIIAKKYHQSNGGIAKSIWGEVFRNGQHLNDVKVVLFYKGVENDETKTDTNGRFQFVDK